MSLTMLRLSGRHAPLAQRTSQRAGSVAAAARCTSVRRLGRHCGVQPLRATRQLADMDEEDDEMEVSSSGSEELNLELALPAQQYQKRLSMKEIKELRTASNTLAQQGDIQRIICGQKGITQTFLNACMDALSKHTFLRIKLGEGAGLERGQAAKALEQYLDAVAVHQVGFTITVYREQGLPRPSNCSEAPGHVAEPEPGQDSATDANATMPAKPRVPHQRASAKSAARVAAARAAAKVEAKRQLQGPPEFSVI